MPINFESLKKRLENEKNKKSSFDKKPELPLWKPVEGTYLIRLMPFNLTEVTDSVYKVYTAMYLNAESKNGKRYSKQVFFPAGSKDPFVDHRRALYATGKKEDKEAAKNFTPQTLRYALVKIHESEINGETTRFPESEQEPQLLKLSKDMAAQIDQLFPELLKKLSKKNKSEDINLDFTDVEDGLELNVKVTYKTQIGGFDVFDYKINFEDYNDRNPAFKDKKTLDSFYKKVPDLDAYFKELGQGTQEDFDTHVRLLCKTLDNQTEDLKSKQKSYQEEKQEVKPKQGKTQSKQEVNTNIDSAFDDISDNSADLDAILNDLKIS